MKGSIRFNNEINVEVAVDPSQNEGAKLLSAVNLVDGQELGSGGGGESGLVEIEYDGVDTYTFKITPNQANNLLNAGIMPWCNNIPAGLAAALEIPNDSRIVLAFVDLDEHDCSYAVVIAYDDAKPGILGAADNDTYFTLVVE